MTKKEFSELLDPNRFEFDPEKLREKYRIEKDKRLRVDGNDQYVEIQGDFSHYVDDPYIESKINRDPLSDKSDVIVVGGGFGGLLAGARLREAGVEKIRIIEKGGNFGGTWYWNRYPGAMCDIESYIYLPLLEELNYMPKEKYTNAPEILEHCHRIAEHYDLYKDALLQTEVTDVSWSESGKNWIIKTNRDDELSSTFVVMSNGPLNRPKLPGIPGVDKFKGHTFHTSRWDYGYTGGSSKGELDRLKDKTIGIIGTGATAVQCIPHLGKGAKTLYVFQRTPSSVDVRNNMKTDQKWVEKLEPGWQKERMDNFNVLVNGGYEENDLVSDGWTEIFRNLTGVLPPEGFEGISRDQIHIATELADFKKMEQVRSRVDSVVKNSETAESLKPYYRQFCKRPCFHDQYLQTFNIPGVHLVDTEGKGVERITENSVVANGKNYEVDCLIFATGFEVGTGYTRQAGYELTGRNGIKLSEKWKNGPTTFHGLHSYGYPNCFFMGFIQTALTPNFVHLLLEQSKHIAHIVREAKDRGLTRIEATKEAEEDWCATIKKLAKAGERFFSECTPGYYNNEGKQDKGFGFIQNAYGGGPVQFFNLLSDWREENKLSGLEFE